MMTTERLENAKEPSKPKHIELYEAILKLDEVLNHLRNLVEEVKESIPASSEVGATPIPDQPSLATMLETGSDMINHRVDEMHEKILVLRSLLF